MPKPLKHVTITGGGGQIAYNLLFRIASGELLGSDQPVALHILEVPAMISVLEGVRMELEDGAYPLLKEIHIGSDAFKIFEDADIAILIGAAPRGPGMERGELLHINSKIFQEQGKALNASANENALVFVVGNPCNTNCLIAMHHAPRIPRTHFHAMTRLDQNRAVSQLAKRAKVAVTEVSPVIIWGNHSSTQVPDFFHTQIGGKPAIDAIADRHWLEKEFIPIIQKRGAAVIAARGKSSAASAAQGIIDSVKELWSPTGGYFSSSVWSKDNPYGIDENLVFSFPCQSNEQGKWEIVPNLIPNEFLISLLKITEDELKQERNFVSALLV